MNIRIVSYRGRHILFHVLLDSEGYVQQLYDEVETSCHDHIAMAEMIDAISEAKKHPIVMLNAGNKKDLIKND